jgi:hypothetical protein
MSADSGIGKCFAATYRKAARKEHDREPRIADHPQLGAFPAESTDASPAAGAGCRAVIRVFVRVDTRGVRGGLARVRRAGASSGLPAIRGRALAHVIRVLRSRAMVCRSRTTARRSLARRSSRRGRSRSSRARKGEENIVELNAAAIEVPEGSIAGVDDLGTTPPSNWNRRPAARSVQRIGAESPVAVDEARSRRRPWQPTARATA